MSRIGAGGSGASAITVKLCSEERQVQDNQPYESIAACDSATGWKQIATFTRSIHRGSMKIG